MPPCPLPADYFIFETMKTDVGQYVVIKDRMGIECLKLRCAVAEVERKAMLEVANRLHMLSFQHRYGFAGTFFAPPGKW
jgi:hypothetical protein